MNISESYLIGIDITDGDEAALSVIKGNGLKLEFVNIITGKDAIKIYELLKGVQKNEQN